jgi:hypothetical protein
MALDPSLKTRECPTPRKKEYRSRAKAMRARLDIKASAAHRDDPPLYPYLCPSGEHWHLTHLPQRKPTPEERKPP